jgi:2,5-diketo-D-gluconate reductase A
VGSWTTLYDGDYVSTRKAVTEFVAQGRLRSAGVSNFQAAHLDRIIAETGIAAARGKSSAQIILRWHMQHGHIAIPKSARA